MSLQPNLTGNLRLATMLLSRRPMIESASRGGSPDWLNPQFKPIAETLDSRIWGEPFAVGDECTIDHMQFVVSARLIVVSIDGYKVRYQIQPVLTAQLT